MNQKKLSNANVRGIFVLFVISFVLLLIPIMSDDAFAKQFQIVTARGNIFTLIEPPAPIIITNLQIFNVTTTLNNTLDETRLSMKIVDLKNANGYLIYGRGTIGVEMPIAQNTNPDSEFEFAAVVLSDDVSHTSDVPELMARYEMSADGSLNFIESLGGKPNILNPQGVNPYYTGGWLKDDNDWTIYGFESRKINTVNIDDLPVGELLTMKGDISRNTVVQIISYYQPQGPNGDKSSYSTTVSSRPNLKVLYSLDMGVYGSSGTTGKQHKYNPQCSYWPSTLVKHGFWSNYPDGGIHSAASSSGCTHDPGRYTDRIKRIDYDSSRRMDVWTYMHVLSRSYSLTVYPNVYANGCQAYVTVSVTAGYQIGSGGTTTVPYTQSPSVSCEKHGAYWKVKSVSIPPMTNTLWVDDYENNRYKKTVKVPLNVRVSVDLPQLTPRVTVLETFTGNNFSDQFTMNSYTGDLKLRLIGPSTATAKVKVFKGIDSPEAFIVTGAPANAPFRLTVGGAGILSGMTSNDGMIHVTSEEMDFTPYKNAKNIKITMWPNAMFGRTDTANYGDNSVLFDTQNRESILFNSSPNVITIPKVFVNVEFPKNNTSIKDVMTVDRNTDVDHDYFDGIYDYDDELYVPIFFKTNEISIIVNNKHLVSERFSDIDGSEDLLSRLLK